MNRFIFLILIFSFITSCTKNQSKQDKPQQQPRSETKQVSIPKFDGKKAFAYLKAQTDFGARVPGSDAHKKCLNYLQLELHKFADAVSLQPFKHIGYLGETIQMTNIISSFNSKATTRILLLAHWDCRPRADLDPDPKNHNKPILGANDAASGVAVLLEIARHLKLNPPTIGIDMLFTDGEDYGKEGDLKNYLLGAKYFANNLPQGFKPTFGILLDMIGDSELEILKEPYSMRYAPDIVELVWSTAKELNVYQFVDEVREYGVIDDHLPLNEVGIKTINIIDFEYPDESHRYWHTLEDTPDKCSPESLEAVGMVVMNVIYKYRSH